MAFERFNQTEKYGSLWYTMFMSLFNSLRQFKDMCIHEFSWRNGSSHVGPWDRNKNSLTLRFLSKIDRTTRALMIDFVMSIMTNCLLLELPERCKPRHAFLVERNEWQAWHRLRNLRSCPSSLYSDAAKEGMIHLLDGSYVQKPDSGFFSDWSRNNTPETLRSYWLSYFNKTSGLRVG